MLADTQDAGKETDRVTPKRKRSASMRMRMSHTKLSVLYRAMVLWLKDSRYGPKALFDRAHSLDASYCPLKLLSLYTDFPLKGMRTIKRVA